MLTISGDRSLSTNNEGEPFFSILNIDCDASDDTDNSVLDCLNFRRLSFCSN